MFGLNSPRLLGSRPAVLAASLPSNKFYLLYILPCVWKFFSNPLSDHDNEHNQNHHNYGGSLLIFQMNTAPDQPVSKYFLSIYCVQGIVVGTWSLSGIYNLFRNKIQL